MLIIFYNQKSINSLLPVISKMAIQQPVLTLHILLTYENGNCPALGISQNMQNGSDVQEAPNLLNQVKVCFFETMEN